MKFFLDTGDLNEIRQAVDLGLIDGVTTNPSLIAKTGRNRDDVIKEICQLVKGSVSAEVLSLDKEGMLKEASLLTPIAPQITIKLPMTWEGLRACKVLSEQGVKTNITLVFSANQALLAAKAGATYVSPFIGRLDDIGQVGMTLIKDIRSIFDRYQFNTQILAASIRHTEHVLRSAQSGADVATMPMKVLQQLVKHPLTDSGIEQFLKDAAR